MEQEMREEQWIVCQLCKAMSRRDSCQWLRACQCPQPFHRQCLQYQVRECEDQYPNKTPSCPFCETLYRVEPLKGPVITALETIARSWYPYICRGLAIISCQVIVDSTSTTFGLLMLSRAYGHNEACTMLLNMDPLNAVTICHALPIAAIIINYIPWEDYFLRSLRRCSSLPVLGVMMPKGGPEPQALRPRSISTFGAIVGGLLLPVFAEITGRIVFSSEKTPIKRLLLGGAVYLITRGILYMYYQQKTYVRQITLAVANYVTPNGQNVH